MNKISLGKHVTEVFYKKDMIKQVRDSTNTTLMIQEI